MAETQKTEPSNGYHSSGHCGAIKLSGVIKFCSRCAIDSSVPDVEFDENGVCTYCYIHEALEKEYPLGTEGKRKVEDTFKEIKSRSNSKEYDCVVGVSGGADSTFLVHLVKEAGLRPLAVHFDNGWNSEISVSNIKKVTEALDVDLQTFVVQWDEFKDLLAAFLRAGVPWADLPTDLALTAALYRTAAAEGIKDIIVGNNFRTEGKVPTEWNYGDSRFIRSVHKKFGKEKISHVPILSEWEIFYYAGVRRIKLLRPMYNLTFNKEEAKAVLKEKYNWQDYGGHHHESIFTRFVLADWLPNRFGIDKRKISYSAMVRSGQMTQKEALQKLSEPPYDPSQMQFDREYVLKKLNIPTAEFEKLITGPIKTHRDFPSYLPIIEGATQLVRLMVKLVLPWKPTLFVEYEVKRKLAAASKISTELSKCNEKVNNINTSV